MQASVLARVDHTKRPGPVLLTAAAIRRRVEVWRERALSLMRTAHELGEQAWLRGEHQLSTRWERAALKLMGRAEQYRRWLEWEQRKAQRLVVRKGASV